MKSKPGELDEEIQHVLGFLKSKEPNSEEYSEAAENLKLLCEARAKRPWSSLEPEMILTVAGNILAILVILNFEKTNIVVSKAFGLVRLKW